MGLDSNQRSLATADLQSAGINHSPTHALNFIETDGANHQQIAELLHQQQSIYPCH